MYEIVVKDKLDYHTACVLAKVRGFRLASVSTTGLEDALRLTFLPESAFLKEGEVASDDLL